jgi:putative transposase
MRQAVAIELGDDTRTLLQSWARSRTLPARQVTRAKIVLLADAGHANLGIAAQLGIERHTVRRWRNRFAAEGVDGIAKERGARGRKPTKRRRHARRIIETTLNTTPPNATHWSIRTLAKHLGVSIAMVQRVWREHKLQPHRVKTFKLSSDPQFIEKLVDVVGLYLRPPEHALVLCVDEKSQIQALDRTQPLLPLGLGYVEGVSHNYIRHGTTTLFAALDIVSGQVLTQCKGRHRHQEFLQFLRHIDANVPQELEIHLVIDNYAAHKHPKVRRWLAARPRYHVHYTPTYASWLNQVEIWFSIITQRAIRRGTFRSVNDLVANIEHFVRNYNKNSRPFVWTATADSILEKIQRLCEAIAGTGH